MCVFEFDGFHDDFYDFIVLDGMPHGLDGHPSTTTNDSSSPATPLCVRNAGWGSISCDVPCDCGIHGTCSSAAIDAAGARAAAGLSATANPGDCICDVGWSGALCDIPCPTDGSVVCGGHGTCDISGTCICSSSNTSGSWGLDGRGRCTVCAPGYWQPLECTATCAADTSGVVCGGRGTCLSSLICLCPQGWAGAACDECANGYFGPSCEPCVSCGAAACSGNGVCDDGRKGSGVCRCDPHFNGSSCSVCADGFWGATCSNACPAGPSGVLCYGHGLCTTTAGCVCDVGSYWSNTAGCGDCIAGYYGILCDRPCACSMYSACSQGVSGDGSCACNSGWVGPFCALACPSVGGTAYPNGTMIGGGGPCSGEGNCVVWPSLAPLPDSRASRRDHLAETAIAIELVY